MKTLRSFRPAGAFALAAISLAAFARLAAAESPALPPGAVSGDTIAVIYFNGPAVSPEKIDAAFAATMGPESVKLLELDDYKAFYKKAIDAGADSAFFVMNWSADSREPQPVGYVHVKDGGDVEALRKATEEGMGDGGKYTTIETTGSYVVFHDKSDAAAKPGTPDDAKPFVDALDKAADSAVTVVVIPNDKIRSAVKAQSDHMPPAVVEMLSVALDSKWARLSIMGGADLAAHLTIQAADEDAAKKLLEEANDGIDQLKKLEEKLKGQPGSESQVKLIDGIIEVAKPKAHGAQVTVDLDMAALKVLGAAALPGLKESHARSLQFNSELKEYQLSQAILQYADKNDQKLPDSFDDLAPFVGGKEALAKLLVNPNTGDKVGYEYVKAGKTLLDVNRDTPLIYELRDGKRVPEGYICYGDFHVDSKYDKGR